MTNEDAMNEAAELQDKINQISCEMDSGASPSRMKQLEYKLNTLRMQRSLLLEANNLRW